MRHVQTGQSGHVEVRHDQIESRRVGFQQSERSVGLRVSADLMSESFKEPCGEHDQRFLIIDEEDSWPKAALRRFRDHWNLLCTSNIHRRPAAMLSSIERQCTPRFPLSCMSLSKPCEYVIGAKTQYANAPKRDAALLTPIQAGMRRHPKTD